MAAVPLLQQQLMIRPDIGTNGELTGWAPAMLFGMLFATDVC
jgi:hypothetical protein